MNRRDFLQIAGGMVVGAMVGGNAPNPVVFPKRPYNNRSKMPEQMADAGEQPVAGFVVAYPSRSDQAIRKAGGAFCRI